MVNMLPFFISFVANNLERHYLLSGDADGTILLWELTLADKKVLSGAFSCLGLGSGALYVLCSRPMLKVASRLIIFSWF